MQTQITKLLGIKYPIIQGGMAWVANAQLAAAVSNAGGLGLIAGGSATADIVREEIKKAKALTEKPFGVNVMLMNPHAEAIIQACIEEKVKVVTTGAGNPGKYIPAMKEAGIKVIPVVASVALAKRMERAGADAVVAEGCEAGGHIGEITTMCLIPQIADAVSIPVIAAGGIADGRGMAAALILGAQGVQVGTRFLVANECTIHQNYKDLVLKAKDTDSIVTGRSTGHPVRSVKNKFAKTLLEMEKEHVDPAQFEEMSVGSLRKAVVDGNVDEGSFMAGQIAGMVTKQESCHDIVRSLTNEARHILTNFEMIRGIELE
ncbi:MAG: enoyl-[acyl-carrier-protein] reductase FabK [Massiliimalia sp.]|jgi:enoyl-[acyl-carrier protein] reductase II